MAVTPQQQPCLLFDTFAPASIAGGDRQFIDIALVLLPSEDSASGHLVAIENSNADLVVVVAAASGKPVLQKNVISVTKNGSLSVDNAEASGNSMELRCRCFWNCQFPHDR